jgi:hypothetical protein
MSSRALSGLSYDAAVRALDLQERAIEQLRARTGTLLTASSITASFLGAQAIQHANGLGVLGVLALVSLACSIGLCVYVLLPKKGFLFSVSATTMYEELFEYADDEGEVQRRLVYWLEEFWKANQGQGRHSRPLLLRRRGRAPASAGVLDMDFGRYHLLDMTATKKPAPPPPPPPAPPDLGHPETRGGLGILTR